MPNQLHNPVTFLRHLTSDHAPFMVRRTDAVPCCDDQPLHEALYRQAPDLYALCGLVDKALPEQQARILFQVLAHSRVELSDDVRQMLDRVTKLLLTTLEAQHVLTVFLALRRARANHKHTRRAILRYLLNHPLLEELANQRRPTLVDCLEHALGKNVARACARFLIEGNTDDNYVRRQLLRFAQDAERVQKVMVALYRKGEPLVSRNPVVTALPAVAVAEELPRTITATNRGDIAATLVHVCRGGSNADLTAALERYVQDAVTPLPHFDGTVALVLDASASTQGYGEREFCCISQSQAFRLVLERCCAKLHVFQVGGSDEFAQPEGDTDLSMAVLDALDTDADVVAIVSDGYENHLQGDLARVMASLPGAGVQTPVVSCHSKFSGKDDLTLRRPAPGLPELEVPHQQDFAEVLWFLFAHAHKGEAFLRQELHRRLVALETGEAIMDNQLIPLKLNLNVHRFGRPQQAGPMTVLPLFGPDANGKFTPPLSGIKLGGVRGYGNVELHNPGTSGVAILPLHMGYIQDQAQNHALCGSAFLGAGQKRVFEDACCVQQAQGGYLESKEQWFFILPLHVREEALRLRGQKNFGKLWPAISTLNQRLGLEERGHLEQVLCRQRPLLTQYQSRVELLKGQTGALFFVGDRLAGVEIAPSAAYFREVWTPLVCFCYGVAAMELESHAPEQPVLPFTASNLLEIRQQLVDSRQQRLQRVQDCLHQAPAEQFDRQEEENYLGLRLFTATGTNFVGQFVEDEGRVVYASLTARTKYLEGICTAN